MSKLYCITAIFNPCSYQSRYRLYHEFKKRCENDGIILYTIEAAFGDQDFAVTSPDDPLNFQVRTSTELWIKENLLNIALRRLPPEAKRIAWIDADVLFCNPTYVEDTLKALNNHEVVQMFSYTQDLDPDHSLINTTGLGLPMFSSGYLFTKTGFTSLVTREEFNGMIGHTGYAWAARREFLEKVGGFYEAAIVGSADKYMMHAFIGKSEMSASMGFTETYGQSIVKWATNARTDVGYVDGMVLHYYHGKKDDRGYKTRRKILIDNAYDPMTDLSYNADGVIGFKGNKPDLEAALHDYFKSRREDNV